MKQESSSTSLRQGSLVRTSLQQEDRQDLPGERAPCSLKSSEYSKSAEMIDQTGLSLRMYLISVCEGLIQSSLYWKNKGTPAGRPWWVLGQSKPRIKGTESGLLPTPNASDNRDRGNTNMPCIRRRILLKKQVGLSMLFDKEPCPMCVEGMMGYPVGWTEILPSEML